MNSTKPSTTVLHRLRLFANRLLAGIGLALVRSGTAFWRREKPLVTARIGRFDLEIPSHNPLSKLYSRHPETSAFVGRVTSILRKKYPRMAGIDIGANVGDTACLIKTAEDIPLICIEGDARTFGFLQKNLAQFGNVSAHQLFLGEKTGTIQATLEKTGWNSTIKPDQNASAPALEIVTLDDFLAARTGVENLKLLKIDTEGFDCAIIRGAVKFISQVAPVITFEYNRENMDAIGEKGLDTLSKLADLGYSHMVIHDPYGRFFCATTLADKNLIRDFHDYADGKNGGIYYYDITVFHTRDQDVAESFVAVERAHRARFS